MNIEVIGFSEHKKNTKEKIKLFQASKEQKGGEKILSLVDLYHANNNSNQTALYQNKDPHFL